MKDAVASADTKGAPHKKCGFIWAWQLTTLEILIPKQRGAGWLKCPAGHHASKRINAIEDAAGCDVCGIDGTLTVECGIRVAGDDELRRALEARLFPVISHEYKTYAEKETSMADICKELGFDAEQFSGLVQ